MESLPDVYTELTLLDLKYQHLREVCRILLKKWPTHTPSGKRVERRKVESQAVDSEKDVPAHKTQPTESQSSDNPPTTDVPVVASDQDELNQLDDILKRAQKIRLSQDGTRGIEAVKKSATATKLSSRSNKLASQVYSAEPQRTKKISTAKITQPATRTKYSSSSVSSSSVRRDKQRARVTKGSAASTTKLRSSSRHRIPDGNREKQVSKGHEHSQLLETKGPVSTAQSFQQDHQGTTKRTSFIDDPQSASMAAASSNVSEEPRSSYFDIEQHGSRLTMPLKYYRLRKALSRLSDELKPEEPSCQHQDHLAGEHFSKRLCSSSKESVDLIGLQLIRDEYQYTKEMILSMTPQEWTVSERSAWKEVLKVNHKLDAIMKHVRQLQNQEIWTLSSTTQSKETPLQSASPTALTFSPEIPFSYSSLEEWQSITTYEHQQHLLAVEEDILKFLKEKILPCLDILMTQERADKTQALTTMLRTAYELAGVTQPKYIRTVDQ